MARTKPTWVFVVGAYRTGSTTQFLLTEQVVQRTKQGMSIGYHNEKRLVEHDQHRDVPYVVCKVFIYLPETSVHGACFLHENRIKVIGTVRDPRDIMVSMRERSKALGNHEWSFEHVVTEELPKWLKQFNQWTDLGKELVHVAHFEDMITNLPREVQAIAKHLDVPIGAAQAGRIGRSLTAGAQKARKKRFMALKSRNESSKEHPVLPSIPALKFATAGHWVDWLSADEAHLIEQYAGEYMERWGYAFS